MARIPPLGTGVEEGVKPREGAGCAFGRMSQTPASWVLLPRSLLGEMALLGGLICASLPQLQSGEVSGGGQ